MFTSKTVFGDYELDLQSIRLANLPIVCSHTVNGVSKLHLDTLKSLTFKDLYELWPEKVSIQDKWVRSKTSIIYCKRQILVT